MDHIEIGYSGITRSDALDQHVRAELDGAIGRFGDRVTRVVVRVADENADKRGPNDRRCTIEARPASMQPLAVEATGDDIYAVVRDACDKLTRALTRRFERNETH